jgi:hypothetical protein
MGWAQRLGPPCGCTQKHLVSGLRLLEIGQRAAFQHSRWHLQGRVGGEIAPGKVKDTAGSTCSKLATRANPLLYARNFTHAQACPVMTFSKYTSNCRALLARSRLARAHVPRGHACTSQGASEGVRPAGGWWVQHHCPGALSTPHSHTTACAGKPPQPRIPSRVAPMWCMGHMGRISGAAWRLAQWSPSQLPGGVMNNIYIC